MCYNYNKKDVNFYVQYYLLLGLIKHYLIFAAMLCMSTFAHEMI